MQLKRRTVLSQSPCAIVVPLLSCLLLAGCQSLTGCRAKNDVASGTEPSPQASPSSPSDQAMRTLLNEQPNKAQTGTTASNAVQSASAVRALDTETTSTSRPSLNLTVSGLEPGAGPLRLAIFRSSSSFPNHESASEKHSVEVIDDVVATEVALEKGQVAIAAYQDLNNDGKLNKGMFGIPTEPYGFSNNAKGTMGPPSFDSALMQSVGTAEITLEKVKL
jgi:uncharacterized protein (DUF2141 family)